MKRLRIFWILLFAFGIYPGSFSYAVPVDTDTTYPKISVIDTAEFYKITINDEENDSLFDISYAWGTVPHAYVYVAVASDDTTNWQFSVKESLRWEYIQERVPARWDTATYWKHPLNFHY